MKAQWVYTATISQRKIKFYIKDCYNTLFSWNLGKKSIFQKMWHQDPFEIYILEDSKSDLSVCLQKIYAMAMLLYPLYFVPKEHIFLHQCWWERQGNHCGHPLDQCCPNIYFSRQKTNSVFRLRFSTQLHLVT